eukprot:gene25646-46736_t
MHNPLVGARRCDMDQPHRLHACAASGSCDARNGDRDVCVGRLKRPFGHHSRDGFGYGAKVSDQVARHPQHLLLGPVGVGHEAAFKDVGRAWNRAYGGGHQPARAALGRHDPERTLPRLVDQEAGEGDNLQIEHRRKVSLPVGCHHRASLHTFDQGDSRPMTTFAVETRVRSAPPALFAVTVFTSAALVFLVQPMVAKLVLPLLGGSSSVWNTSMAFFQIALLAGYAYAHLLQRIGSVRNQALVHCAALVMAAIALPLRVNELAGPPSSDHPNLWLLAVLTLSIGAPFAILSATAPL